VVKYWGPALELTYKLDCCI